jgi:hypothetical protein
MDTGLRPRIFFACAQSYQSLAQGSRFLTRIHAWSWRRSKKVLIKKPRRQELIGLIARPRNASRRKNYRLPIGNKS